MEHVMHPTIILSEAAGAELQYFLCVITVSASRSAGSRAKQRYIPRGRNQLHTIFDRHFDEFCDIYDERYAATYGMFRLDRIRDIGERFLTCGDYRLGVARIRCTNPACGHCRNRKRFLPAERPGRSADYLQAFQLQGILSASIMQSEAYAPVRRTPDQ